MTSKTLILTLAGVALTAASGVAQATTYQLALQEVGVNSGDVETQATGNSVLSSSLTLAGGSYGAWSNIVAVLGGSTAGSMSLQNVTEWYTPTANDGPALTIWATAQNISGLDTQLVVTNTDPLSYFEITDESYGLPVGWQVVESVYWSATNAALPADGDTSGFTSLGSETFTSTATGVTSSGGFSQVTTLSLAGQDYSLVEEYKIVPTDSATSTVVNGGVIAAATAVPEPSTWAMLGLGFASLGVAGYRSRKSRPAVAIAL